MRNDFNLAINQLCAERRLPPEVVKEAVMAALVSAYKRNFGATQTVEVKLEPATGEVRVFAAKDIVDVVIDSKVQISLSDARLIQPAAQVGETVQVESTPRDFGRIAAQTAKQVILQRIREAERDALFSSFANSEGEIAHGTIQSIDFHSQDAIVNLDGAEAVLPAKEQVPSEKYRRGARLRAFVLEVRRGSRGPHITLSRRTPLFLRRLLELEVPEVFSGAVEVKNMAREAGSRSKVAVHATQEGVDPVGSCVGVRGGRIQNVVNELGGEKIDVVQWSPDVAVYIANSLSPAKVMNVLLDENGEGSHTATVIVPDRQLSLAIGRDGQNARLAAKLTGWRIDIKSASETAEETLGRLKDRVLSPDEKDLFALAEAILQKRESSGLTAEERERVQQEVQRAGDDSLPWPVEEPVAATMEATQVAAAVTQPVVPAQDRSEARGVEIGQQTAPQGKTQEPAPAEEAEPQPTLRRPFDEAAALAPSFDGEPVEESSGWVKTESPEDPYSGWQDNIEVGSIEDELEREEGDDDRPLNVAAAKKAKKKKSGKSRFARKGAREGWE